MIPSYISPDVKSNAEKKIFEWFKKSTGTESWIVLHSLGISKHIRFIYGEIDFLVLAPRAGVFALEVKGGRVKRQDGIWYFTDKYGNTTSKPRGPFAQASDGIYSVIGALRQKYGKDSGISKVLYGYGVMFPDIVFDDDTIEISRWQIFDKNDGNNVKEFINRLSHNYLKQIQEKYNVFPEKYFLNTKIIREIVSYLRGDFDKPVAFQTEINATEEIQKKLTEEQLRCLDALEDNPRCLIQGPAGTGKTILAIEDTVRSVTNNENVALICFNALLGEHLKQYFKINKKYGSPYYVGTFHSFMFHVVKNAGIEVKERHFEQDEFWNTDMPLLVLEALDVNPVGLDKIIVDEAQDLIIDNYLDVFDALLPKGIAGGKWSFFGDFSSQSIYNDISQNMMMEILEKRIVPYKYKLLINCRNTLPICKEIQNVTGFLGLKYPDIAANGPPVNYLTWKNENEQIQKINLVLDRLINKDHISPDLVTILSPRKMEDSVVFGSSMMIKYYDIVLNDSLSFCTIQSFKGLENSVILLVDIESYSNSKLLYTGLSRARAALYVFESERAHSERTKLLLKAVKNDRYQTGTNN
jgi:hypothetical protein